MKLFPLYIVPGVKCGGRKSVIQDAVGSQLFGWQVTE